MSVMSALVLSVLLGLACTWTKAAAMTALLEELRKIVLEIVTRVVIPVLPVFIGFTFCALSYEGAATKQLPVFIQVILIVILDTISGWRYFIPQQASTQNQIL